MMLQKTLAQEAAAVSKLLKKSGHQLVLAESCTGGMIASSLVANPGISENLCGSFVVYQVKSKKKWLGLNPKQLKRDSVESWQTAREMAKAALRQTPFATIAASTTGFLTSKNADDDGRICFSVAIRKGKKIEVRETVEVHLKTLQRDKNHAPHKLVASLLKISSNSPPLPLRLKRQMLASWVSLSMVRGLLRGKPTPH
ncbi:MAG: CinA family protein [Bdellovibrionales bacterium]|nr:CinA family protein [Bdellovibrionales bacterium]